ncbi:MAG: DNA polymerase III subunit [Acidobacteria bacterium]|nr:DNA polymerase III subunit [Acidobacteriota bacterium]
MPLGDIIGHQPVIELLARAVARDSLPPSLIFAGLEGVGKRTTAVAVAQALNCQAPASNVTRDPSESTGAPTVLELDACGKCPGCRRIARCVHGDVQIIEPLETGNIVIEQVRDAVERSAYRPFEGRRRVVIIDGADAMGEAAQDALLKTLEEPPSSSVFILVTARPDALLPTVRSRCARLRFGPLAEAEIAAALRDRMLGEDEARAAAVASGGSLGYALRADTREFAQARSVAAGLLQTLADTSDPRRRFEAAKTIHPRDRGRQTPAEQRAELATILRVLSSLLRDLAIFSTRADDRLVVNADLAQRLRTVSRAFDGSRITRAFSAVGEALVALDERNASPKIVADWLVFQL